MKQYKTGLVIGRFQPFHKGHLHLIVESLKIVDKLIIGIGTANRVDLDNPWTKEERRLMLEEVIREEKLEDRIIKIVDVNDYLNDDEAWYKNAASLIGKVDIVVGNNDWVNHLYKLNGTETTGAHFYKRYLLEGYKIRKLIREENKWQDRVPDYLLEFIRTNI